MRQLGKPTLDCAAQQSIEEVRESKMRGGTDNEEPERPRDLRSENGEGAVEKVRKYEDAGQKWRSGTQD